MDARVGGARRRQRLEAAREPRRPRGGHAARVAAGGSRRVVMRELAGGWLGRFGLGMNGLDCGAPAPRCLLSPFASLLEDAL